MNTRSNKFLVGKGFFAVVAVLSLVGCAGSGEGLDQGGRPIVNPGPNTQFQEIQDTIFTPICTVCHTGSNAPQGLRLDAGVSYSLLVNVASAEVPSLMRVNPGNPDQSYIVQKLQGNAAGGVRMPYGGPYLSQAQIDLVRAWIAAGAPAAFTPTQQLALAGSIPGNGETAPAGTNKITLVFNSDVDASLLSGDTLVLRDANDQPVASGAYGIPQGRPNVVELTLPQALAAGSYQLQIGSLDGITLANTAGQTLAEPALIPFDVDAGASR
jgi:methionine-rich copper-binding protein CopC